MLLIHVLSLFVGFWSVIIFGLRNSIIYVVFKSKSYLLFISTYLFAILFCSNVFEKQLPYMLRILKQFCYRS